jgi:hypothetical protein
MVRAGLILAALAVLSAGGGILWNLLHATPARTDDALIGLHVYAEGKGLRVTWDRTTALVRQATGAKLTINDGGVAREASLDPAQLASGSIIYTPNSNDVVIWLEMQTAAARAPREMVRVLSGQHPAEISATTVQLAMDRSAPPVQLSKGAPAAPIQPIKERSGAPIQLTKESSAASIQPTREAVRAPSYSEPTVRAAMPLKAVLRAPVKVTSGRISQPAVLEAPTATPTQQGAPAIPEPLRAAGQIRMAPAPIRPDARSNGAPGLPTPEPMVNVTPPNPVKRVIPDMAGIGWNLNFPVDVNIQVTVDASGHVIEAHEVAGDTRRSLLLVGRGLRAARLWEFAPGLRDGKPIQAEYTMVFHFRPR